MSKGSNMPTQFNQVKTPIGTNNMGVSPKVTPVPSFQHPQMTFTDMVNMQKKSL